MKLKGVQMKTLLTSNKLLISLSLKIVGNVLDDKLHRNKNIYYRCHKKTIFVCFDGAALPNLLSLKLFSLYK